MMITCTVMWGERKNTIYFFLEYDYVVEVVAAERFVVAVYDYYRYKNTYTLTNIPKINIYIDE